MAACNRFSYGKGATLEIISPSPLSRSKCGARVKVGRMSRACDDGARTRSSKERNRVRKDNTFTLGFSNKAADTTSGGASIPPGAHDALDSFELAKQEWIRHVAHHPLPPPSPFPPPRSPNDHSKPITEAPSPFVKGMAARLGVARRAGRSWGTARAALKVRGSRGNDVDGEGVEAEGLEKVL